MAEKELFEIAINDWMADNAEEMSSLKIVEIYEEGGEYKALAQDDLCTYQISDSGDGNLMIHYLGKR